MPTLVCLPCSSTLLLLWAIKVHHTRLGNLLESLVRVLPRQLQALPLIDTPLVCFDEGLVEMLGHVILDDLGELIHQLLLGIRLIQLGAPVAHLEGLAIEQVWVAFLSGKLRTQIPPSHVDNVLIVFLGQVEEHVQFLKFWFVNYLN